MKIKNKTLWKAFNVEMPEELKPLYELLQDKLSMILNQSSSRAFLETLDVDKPRGAVWLEMHTFFKPKLHSLKINNKAWFSRMIYENLRRELESKRARLRIYDFLEKNDFNIDQKFRDELIKNKLFPTFGYLQNMIDSRKPPELSRNMTFVMDYSIKDPQMFIKDEDNTCHYKISDSKNKLKNWITQEISLPYTLNGNVTGRISNPRFIKRKKDNKYIGVVSYEYVPETTNGDNILGVDLGKNRFYNAVVLYSNSNYSDSFSNSRKIEYLKLKLEILYSEKKKLLTKVSGSRAYGNNTSKQSRRESNLKCITEKIINLKVEMSRLAASEIIQVARDNNCKEIHLENLSWLKSKGGKWNYSMIQRHITEKAIGFGIRAVIVNAAYSSSEHPINKEKGKEFNREIIFNDGFSINRDDLAAINLAVRNKTKGSINKSVTLRKGRATPKRVKLRKHYRTKIRFDLKINKGKVQIVAFPQDQVETILFASSEAVVKKSFLLPFPME